MRERDIFEIYDSIGAGVALLKMDYTIEFINREIEINSGANKEKIVGKNFLDFVHINDRSTVVDMLESAKKGLEKRIIVRLRSLDGRTVWVHLSSVVRKSHLVLTLLDMTASVLDQKSLKEKNEELQLAYDFVNAISSSLDPEEIYELSYQKISEIIKNVDAFIISRVDKKNKKIVAEFVIGENKKYPKQYVTINDKDTITGWIVTHRKELYIRDTTNDLLPANLKLIGTPMISWVGIPLFHNGEVLGVLSVQSKKTNAFTDKDLHILKLVSGYLAIAIYNANLYESLKESELKYRGIVRSSIVGILSTNTNNHLTFINSTLSNMLGYCSGELLGKNLLEIVPEMEHKKIKAAIARRRKGISDTYESYLQRKDGTVIPVLIYASPLRDEQNNIIGTMGSIIDISTMKELRRKLIEAKHFQETLLHIVSHDLKTPLSVIQGYVDISREEFEPEYLDRIECAVSNALDLIHDARLLSKIDMNKMDEAKDEFYLREILIVVADLVRSRFPQGKIELRGNDPTFTGHKTLIKEVFLNLMVNAFKYGAGKVDVFIGREKDKIVVEIADDGPGISDDKKSKIFESFVKYGTGGSGLGLFIVKRILGIYNGRIRVEDNHPNGSVFIVELPVSN